MWINKYNKKLLLLQDDYYSLLRIHLGNLKQSYLNCKFETVELTFQLKTASEFSKNLVSDSICFNVREIPFDMTNRNISILIKTKVTGNGIKLSLI